MYLYTYISVSIYIYILGWTFWVRGGLSIRLLKSVFFGKAAPPQIRKTGFLLFQKTGKIHFPVFGKPKKSIF